MAEERHPIEDAPPWALEDRVRHLEMHLAQLWDQVWWLSLPKRRRQEYEAQGFRSPVTKFYDRPEPPWRRKPSS